MEQKPTNIYKQARKSAGLTQERAAEAIGVSVDSIKDYEAYNRLPPNDIVEMMCVVYDAMYLAYQHTSISTGKIKVVPDVEVRDLPTATIRLINRVLDFATQHRDRQLMQIAEDGIITDDERPLFNSIMDELDQLVKAAVEIKLARERSSATR